MKKFSFLIVLILLVIGGIAVWWIGSTAAVDTSDTKQRTFVINKGQSVREIATDLKNEGLIKDTVAFFLLIKTSGLDGKIQAGLFYLSPSMNMQQIVKSLQVGTHDTRITIPEGKRAEEVADILKENFTAYDPSWRQILVEQEGYLFPDTYSLPKDATIDEIVSTMTGTFDKKYATLTGARQATYTKKEIVTIASMVEREAKFAEDRPLVASVILNRLSAGMSLDIDATVQYAVGNEQNWWPTLTTYARDVLPGSAYNTYRHAGLPPTPISNPGIDVLRAVIEAPETNYVFYITDPKTGRNVYATTLDQHNANIEKYGL
jgi:UPF0755 protein